MLKIRNLEFKKIEVFFGGILIFGYLLTRLFHLTIIPVFVDEAIYIRWAQVMRAVSSLRFLPLSDGKQPLFMWLVIPFLKFISDPLVAGRMVSVLAGLGTMIGVFVLSFLLFRKKEISFFASLLYLVTPFTLFFDRMALADGLLSFFGVWILNAGILLAIEQRFDAALITGILLGLGLLTKSPALFFALLIPVTIIFFPFKEKKLKGLVKLFGLWLVVGFLAGAIYNILRLGPEFHMIALRNKDYIFTFSEILHHPFNPFWGNFKNAFSWFWILLTPMVLLTGTIGGIYSLWKNIKSGLLLWLWILLPLLGQSTLAKVYTSRYILFIIPFFLIFSAVAIEKFWQETKNKYLVIVGLAIIFFLPVYQSFLLLTVPQKAWLPKNERSGYLEMWTAGYGIKEASLYIKDIAKTQKVLVGTEGYFGTLPDGLQIYLEKVPDITVIGVGQPIKEISDKLTNGLKDSRVFLLVNDSRFEVKDQSKIKLVQKYPKAKSQDGSYENLLFFEVLK